MGMNDTNRLADTKWNGKYDVAKNAEKKEKFCDSCANGKR